MGGRRGVLVVVALAIAGVVAFLLLRGGGDVAPGPAPVPPAATPAPRTDAPPAAPAVPPTPPAEAPEPAAPAPAEPAKAAGTLVVTVTASSTKAPIEGATVEVRTEDEPPKVLVSRTTGPDGVARFEGLEPDEVGVRATAPGRVPGKESVNELRTPGVRTVAFELAPGYALGGVVLAAGSRAPVPRAAVKVEMGGSIGFMSSACSDPEHSETTADDEGRFRVDGIPPGEIVTISADAPGRVRGKRSLMLGEGAESHPPVEILLEEACRIEGAVLDPSGNPVAGADVRAFAVEAGGGEGALAKFERDQGAWSWSGREDGAAKTGADGRYSIDGLRVGTPYRLLARAKGFARSRATDPPLVAESADARPSADLRLRAPAVVRVRVGEKDGAPLGEPRAWIEDRFDTLEPEKEGAAVFRFDTLVPGDYDVWATCPGFSMAKESVTLADGETREVRLTLEKVAPSEPIQGFTGPKPGKIRLRPSFPAGTTPPAKVVVALEYVPNGGGSSSTYDVKDGVVELEFLEPKTYRVLVAAEGFAPAVRDAEVAAGEVHDLGVMALDQGVEFSGVVQDSAGKPLAGARVMVDLPAYQHAVGTTDAEGRFRITRLPAWTVDVRVGFAGLLDGTESLTLGAAGSNRTYTLVPGVKIRGSVKGPDGKPRAGVRVAFRLRDDAPPGTSRMETEWPDDAGDFSTEVAAGEWEVEVQDDAGKVLLARTVVVDAKAPARLDLVLP